jgi:hypothetical protein
MKQGVTGNYLESAKIPDQTMADSKKEIKTYVKPLANFCNLTQMSGSFFIFLI